MLSKMSRNYLPHWLLVDQFIGHVNLFDGSCGANARFALTTNALLDIASPIRSSQLSDAVAVRSPVQSRKWPPKSARSTTMKPNPKAESGVSKISEKVVMDVVYCLMPIRFDSMKTLNHGTVNKLNIAPQKTIFSRHRETFLCGRRESVGKFFCFETATDYIAQLRFSRYSANDVASTIVDPQ